MISTMGTKVVESLVDLTLTSLNISDRFSVPVIHKCVFPCVYAALLTGRTVVWPTAAAAAAAATQTPAAVFFSRISCCC